MTDVTKSIGRGIRNFKRSYHEIDVEAHDIEDDPKLLEQQKKNRK